MKSQSKRFWFGKDPDKIENSVLKVEFSNTFPKIYTLTTIFQINLSIVCFTIYQTLTLDRKQYPHRKTTPFPTRPISWSPDRTVPRIKQNTTPWPDFFRPGCMVRSGDPRRSAYKGPFKTPMGRGTDANQIFAKFFQALPLLDLKIF